MTIDQKSPVVEHGHKIIINEAVALKPEEKESLARIERKLELLLQTLEVLKVESAQNPKGDVWYQKVSWARVAITSALLTTILSTTEEGLPTMEKLLSLALTIL